MTRRPTTLAPAITDNSEAALAVLIPRSIPCTGKCNGTVVSEGKNKNCMAQSVQNRRDFIAEPRPALGSPPLAAAADDDVGGFMSRAATSRRHAAPMPSVKAAERQPNVAIRTAAANGSNIWPTAVPVFTTPVMIPTPLVKATGHGRERDHVMRAHAKRDENAEDQEQLPGLAHLRDQRKPQTVGQARCRQYWPWPQSISEKTHQSCEHAPSSERQATLRRTASSATNQTRPRMS